MNITLTIVAVAASVLGSGMALPQAVRLARTGQSGGVSPTWIGVSLAINAWWSAYAVAVSLWALLPVAVLSFALYSWIAAVYLRRLPSAALALAVGAATLGMVPLPALLAADWHVAGIVIGLSYGLQLAPAVLAAYRSPARDGISPATWTMAVAESVLWLVYGVAVADGALVAGGLTGVVMGGAILARLAVDRLGDRTVDAGVGFASGV